MKVILKKLDQSNINEYSQGCLIEGYTRAITKTEDGSKIILHAQPCFQDKKWYYWAYDHFKELNASGMVVENYYPAKIVGFITINRIIEAVIYCSDKASNWTERSKKSVSSNNSWNYI